MAQLAKKEKKLATTMMPDWSLLPEELLEIISMHLENCFDVVHARSVCRSWRSTLPFPACLLRPSYTIPLAPGLPSWVGKDRGILKRVPLFLFRLRTHVDAASPSGYFLGGIGQDKLEDYTNLSSSLQCSVKVNILGFDATMINMIDCQIVPLGHQYRMVGCYRRQWTGFAFFPLNEGGEEFVVLFNHASCLLVFRSPEMSWIFLNNNYILTDLCKDIVTFRGRFYAVFVRGGTVVIDPHSLKVTPLMPLERLNLHYYLVPCGDDELFLVEEIIPCTRVTDFSRWACRVSRLDEEAGKWVVVTDLGDRVLFIADQGCCSCSAKDLPDGCGLNGNSILFTDKPSGETYAYKYGVDTGNGEDDLGFWRFSREKRVTILDNFPQVVAFQV